QALQETKQNEKLQPVKIRGILTRAVFHNQINGWSVLRVEDEEGQMFTAVGNMPSLRTGDKYEFTGFWKEHPQYGRQLAFTDCKVILPEGKQGATAYLTTLTYGIGPVKAKKIVDALGDNALQVIIQDPSKLYELDFVTQQQAQDIVEKLTQNTVLAELSALICKQGVTPALAAKIYAQYGSKSIEVVKENPYVLADEIWGVGFKRADAVAQSIGVKPNSPYRIEAALKFMLKDAGQEGHVYMRPRDTVSEMDNLLGKGHGISIPEISEAAQRLIERGEIIREGDAMYSKTMYKAEVTLARNMRMLAKMEPKEVENIDELIENIQQEFGVAYAEEQQEAIRTAVRNHLTIVTGGPGTGKTTVVRGIISAYRRLNPSELLNPIYLSSPTGRAAKRMTEATGYEAKTIHRLLCYNPFIGGFEYNEEEQLEPGLLIVDEFSMTDIELANDLFKAIPPEMQVVLVGDIDQLPSVGPGSVLRDAIVSGVVPTVRLRFNYRQAGGSIIAQNAHLIVNGEMPPLYEKEGDWETRFVEDNDQALEVIKTEVKLAIEQGLGIMDFQVLAPMRRGPCGIENLNEVVREIVNPKSEDKPELKYGRDTVYRLGDKVMVIQNNYRLGVFNGDLGQITEIGKTGLMVNFEGENVFFKQEDLDILTLAYASTIHKSQGSEFPLAIVVCVRSHWIMLQRNLLYTGITRAKDKLVLVCQESAVERCVKNNEIKERRSLLAERLRKELSSPDQGAQ
ncbi:MAG: exodeoxyribonuclease alpha subunit, partial [Clostridia bacterium]|nr:exodeoxyribonuclease alpha subunit [Clostridia bacterium]